MTTDAPKARRPRWFWIAAAVAGLGICGVVATMGGDDGAAPTPTATKAAGAGLTLANFESIKTGDDCAALEALFGAPGTLTSETAVDDLKIQMFDWTKESLTNVAVVSIMCHNGKVDTKSQVGLR